MGAVHEPPTLLMTERRPELAVVIRRKGLILGDTIRREGLNIGLVRLERLPHRQARPVRIAATGKVDPVTYHSL